MDDSVWMEEQARTIEGRLWIRGNGPIPADYMFIGERPGDHEQRLKTVFVGQSGTLLRDHLIAGGFQGYEKCYLTNAVKYTAPRGKSVVAGDIKRCAPLLAEEIDRVNPKVIVCLGTAAVKAIMGNTYGIESVRGMFVPHPTRLDCVVYSMHNPAYLLRNPEAMSGFDKDIAALVRYQRGEVRVEKRVDTEIIQTVEVLKAFVARMRASTPMLVIDLEWHGKNYMDAKRYIRTVQIGYDYGRAAIIELHFENGVQAMDDLPAAWASLKELLTDPRIGIIGHNVISDGQWLMAEGIDIRKNVVWDTMLAEYLLNEIGPFGLDEVACKYTDYGRYSLALELWVKAHKKECLHGYGPVPRDLLIPYGGIDVDVPRLAMDKQFPLIKAQGFMEPRGKYPSLWDITLRTQELFYELEGTGLLVDKERLEQLITAYQGARSQLFGVLTTLAAALHYEAFRPTSVDDVRKLLFGTEYLALTPVKTTDNKSWGSQPSNRGMDDLDAGTDNSSTDKTVLEILQDAHPIVRTLLNFRRIDTACKTWLRHAEEGEDEVSKGGGLPAKIWPDGRIHSHFSPLSATGRFRSSKPNVQNFPKKAEGYMQEIFGDNNVPPALRTSIIPPPGWVLIEADFKSAELFVLAALSGDRNMWNALNTPGRDLHDLTAISAFKLRVLGPDGRDVPEEYLVEVATRHGADSKEFKALVDSLIYVDNKGRRMTRKEFKKGIRVSAKNVNFGIPYGRGPAAIALQVKAETGTKQTVQQLETELAEIVTAWKEDTYPTAWKYMCDCADCVYDPGYLVNPWGRKRRFPRLDDSMRPDMERQAQNFNIQSTVGDTCMIAMDLVDTYRKEHGMRFKMQSQIHDALMLEAPIEEIDACKTMFLETMGNIEIPVGPPFGVLKMGVDIEVLQRWHEAKED